MRFWVQCDFAENYTFVLQNEAQSYHWNKDQATIHPFVVYFKNDLNELCHLSYVIISNSLKHNVFAVHVFISKLITFLKQKIGEQSIQKMYYVTDGAASQYKNIKNFVNILYHKTDFNIDCEWHFHATSHGKSACDGIGGTVKRMARIESLSRDFDKQIKTPIHLYNWLKKSNENGKTQIQFCYVEDEEIKLKSEELSPRYEDISPIKGTQQFHGFIPQSCDQIEVKTISKNVVS